MFKGGRVTTIVFVTLGVVFAWGVYALLVMRFETGAMFPPYSSYRNDPIGTKALFATLETIPGMEAVRYVDPLSSRLEGPAEQTILLIGANTQQPDKVPQSFVEELDAVMERGGRVVIAFAPNLRDFLMEDAARGVPPGIGRGDEEKADDDAEPVPELAETMVELRNHWGIDLMHEPLRVDGDGNIITQEATLQSDDVLPLTLEWHNGLHFDIDETQWQPLYKCFEDVVAAKRAVGKGTLVFIGDSYYLTNEGVAANRQPELLAWLIGDNTFVQFDEQHLGMQRNPGAAALMRRYNLESLLFGIIGLALLFAWRAGTSLAPRYEDALPGRAADLELGRDAHAGFANLVQRSTPPSEAVRVCVDQWRESVLPGLGRADAKEVAEALKETAQANQAAPPVDAYRAVLNQLRERNVITAYDRKS